MNGLFITLEGGEGAGKTTQCRLLYDYFMRRGREVVLTREPGGTVEGEKIRNLLVQRDGGQWTPMAECLLFFAARQMHVEKLIKPALAAGKIVICDRFSDSTLAYQGYGHGFDHETIRTLDQITLRHFTPHLTLLLDIAPDQGVKRSLARNQTTGGSQNTEDRFEHLKLEFHEKLRAGFLEIAQQNPQRIHVIDADQSADQIYFAIVKIIEAAHAV